MVNITEHEATAFALNVLRASGLALDDAQPVAEGLVDASKRGMGTHGLFRLPQYSRSLRVGQINSKPVVAVLSRRGCTALVDANGGYGFRPTHEAVDIGIELAREHGVAIVGVRNSHHFGTAGAYTRRAAKAGFIGMVTTTTSPRIAPTGAMGPVVGNNPISIAVPRRAPAQPLVLDMALSQVAAGRIRVAAANGNEVPLGWGYDSSGRPTVNPHEILSGGLLAPIGEHKGYGLSVMVELLAGAMTGSPFGLAADNHSNAAGGVGHFVLVISPDFMRDRDEFLDSVEELVRQIRSSPRIEGGKVYLPGEIEDQQAARAEIDGIAVTDSLGKQLAELAAELGIAPLTTARVIANAG